MIYSIKQKIKRKILNLNFSTNIQFVFFDSIWLRNGKRIVKKIRKIYGNESTICICPYKGTGDVYLAASYFKNSEYNNIKNLFCVIGGSNKKISQLFQLKTPILQFEKKEIDSLTRLSFFLGLDKLNVKILHHDPLNWHGGINDMFRNINNLDFTDLIGYGAFKVRNSKELSHPIFLKKDKEIDDIFIKLCLRKKKTVLIAPYSYTLSVLPEWFWKKLVYELIQMGFSVCTNLGSMKEKAIAGTKGVFLRYEQLGVFLRNAGYFIGVRSGFCDVVSSIPCKKIVLYQPYMFWGDGENIDYFSLNTIGLCDDVVELQHDGINFYKLIEDIKDNL